MTRARERLGWTLLALVFLVSAWHLARWPVGAVDGDVWFHLHSGRWLWEHGAIPRDSAFVSFLSPPRPFVDYSWLFEALIYPLQAAAGFGGLAFLRAALFLLTLGLISRAAMRAGAGVLRTVCLAAFYAAVLAPRFKPDRPHDFSLCLLAATLVLLELEPPSARWLLPGLAVLWCNLHGIYWPLLVLCAGAYGVERVLRRRPPAWWQAA
ncbi:MAG: hypothetical protein KGL53_15670, partial [Elusimicrobia bacterium]|nr:hypothetical protein [Elusimicrobiota bacterium]